MIILIVEIVVLRLSTNKTIFPVVGNTEAQVKVQAEHAVVHLRLCIPVVKLITPLTIEHPNGFIAGADPDYDEALTETSSRGLAELQPGDEIKFLYDFYSYDGTFDANYTSRETLTVTGEPFEIGNIALDRPVKSYYKFTDIYNQEYWSEEL